jgi:hypothetical protein
MIDEKDIKPGVWLKWPRAGQIDQDADDIIVLHTTWSLGKPWVHIWNWPGGYEDSIELDWIRENCKISRRQRWKVSKPSQAEDDDFYTVCGSSPKGKKHFVTAGCMFFEDIDDAEYHWKNRVRKWLEPAENKALNNHRLAVVRNFRRTLARRQAEAA